MITKKELIKLGFGEMKHTLWYPKNDDNEDVIDIAYCKLYKSFVLLPSGSHEFEINIDTIDELKTLIKILTPKKS
jgi:hypothetical protein